MTSGDSAETMALATTDNGDREPVDQARQDGGELSAALETIGILALLRSD